jgi:hypothetical protein
MNRHLLVTVVSVLVSSVAVTAGAETKDRRINWEEGFWRLEISGWTGIDSGRRDRTNDNSVTISGERELIATKRITLGPKFFAFSYNENGAGDHRFGGAGFGIAFRFYTNAEQRGFFFEISESLALHTATFAGNDSHFNFMSDGGVGYEGRRHWHGSLRVRHFSHAGLNGDNSGANNLGIAFGKRF